MTGADATSPPLDAGSAHAVARYVALGSSSTAGFGASDPAHAYVSLLSARLTAIFPDLHATNLGAGGATIGLFLGELDRIERARPDLVTILPFTDDVRTSTPTYRAGYARLLDALGAIGATVFFGDNRIDPNLVCGTGSGPGGCYATRDRDTLARKNAIVAELARTRPFVVVVPVLDQNVAHPEWSAPPPDGHPNDLGHRYLADTFWAAIQPWIAP